MGNSVSKAKIINVISTGGRKSDFPSFTTSSSERTVVEKMNHESGHSKSEKKEPSILPNRFFFNHTRNSRFKGSKPARKKTTENCHYVSIKKSTISPKNTKARKKKKANITKSIIGKPTNFKHLNSSTSSNGLEMHVTSDENDTLLTSQMIAIAGLIKPLPNSMSETPNIPPRTSSYHNGTYLKNYPIHPTPLSPPSKPRKNKRLVDAPVSSIKKSRKNQVKYVSIGKASMTHKRVHHSKTLKGSMIV